ncbi:MAG TPA: PAS domain S-box protein [Gaiellaceae bacterium]|nr:PAS domain S-box protein [Gaiellaceae bacterium]
MRARWLVLGGAAALALAGLAAWLILSSGHAEDSGASVVLAVGIGLAFVGSGLIALWRRPENRTGLLLAGVGYLWFLGALTAVERDWVFTVGLAFGAVAFGTFVHLLLAFPWGRLAGRRDRLLVTATYALAVGGNVALLLVDPQPLDSCPDCRSAIALTDSAGAQDAVRIAFTVAAVALVGAILWVVGLRFKLASPALRRVLGPVLATGVTALATLSVQLVAESLGWTHDALSYLFLVAFALVPVAFLAGILRARLARSAVGDLLLALAEGAQLREALARSLHDPTLDVVYWLPERDGFVWHDGTDFKDEGGPRVARYVEHNGQRVGAILHDPSLTGEPELVDAVAAAAALWLDHGRLQAELRAQLTFLLTIVDTAPSLLLSLDTEGRIVNLNLACRRAAGVDDDEHLRFRYFWDVFVAEGEREEVQALFAAAAPDFEPLSDERTFTDARGEERTIAWSAAPLLGEDGAVRNVVCGGLDITLRRRRELELEVERNFASTVANTIPVVLAVVDENAVLAARPNRAFEQILGWDADEMVGRNLLELIDAPDEDQALMAIASAANGVPAADRESVWRCGDGGTRTIAWTAREIRRVDGRVGVLVSGVDVTERHRQEAEVRASRSRIVEAADAARRQLERNLHDGAQQRLVALSVTLRLAQARLEQDPVEARRTLDAARAELALALDELRELARGIHPAILTDRGLTAALEALAARSPVPVEVETDGDGLPPAVEAAAYYVAAEALANVAKYAEAGRVRVRVAREDGTAVVEVTDDGRGGADPTAGTGLRGLADRVEALDGRLVVESPAGGGTCVRAELPVAVDSVS